MGDRAQVHMVETDVWLYTHWGGSDLIEDVRRALSKEERWTDSCYLARIIFDSMKGGDVEGTESFGICNRHHSDVVDVIHVDSGKKQIRVSGFTNRHPNVSHKPHTFEEFINGDF